MSITQEKLKELLSYDSDKGVFTWRINPSKRVRVGDIAGSTTNKGYSHIGVEGKTYQLHRLAWLYVYGKFPDNFIDHLNGIKTDNRICNLRDVTKRENASNCYTHRDGKLIGTYPNKSRSKWKSQIFVDGKLIYLGIYKTQLEAHEIYKKAVLTFAPGC